MKDGAFQTIDILASGNSQALGINNRGQIVGTYSTPLAGVHGYLLDHKELTVIDFPDSFATSVYDINNHGMIVGTYNDTGGAHGFVARPVP